jgi:hypothetical protein
MAETRNISLGSGNYNEYIAGNYIQGNASDRKSLAEAASEIQALLKQLEIDNPTATESQQSHFVNTHILPSNKDRLLNAVKQGGLAIFEEFLDTPYVNVIGKIIDGWQKV